MLMNSATKDQTTFTASLYGGSFGGMALALIMVTTNYYLLKKPPPKNEIIIPFLPLCGSVFVFFVFLGGFLSNSSR